jgi:putative sterol carrier protein
MANFQTIMEKLKKKIEVAKPGRMEGLSAVYQFELLGDGGGVFQIVVYDGLSIVAAVEHDNPNITITMAAEDFVAMLDDELNATSAFMAQKLKVKGDLSLAMKLQSLLG